MYQPTAAHPTMPLPSYARVTNLKNNKSIIVRVAGPFCMVGLSTFLTRQLKRLATQMLVPHR